MKLPLCILKNYNKEIAANLRVLSTYFEMRVNIKIDCEPIRKDSKSTLPQQDLTHYTHKEK